MGDDVDLQPRVWSWMLECFGEQIAKDREERGDRFLEEVFELLQSGGYNPARVLALRDYVWGREAGEPAQEVGGVMITLAAYCHAHGLNMHEAGETELARIWTKVDAIRAKQAAKPKGSALPIVPITGDDTPTRDEVERDELYLGDSWAALLIAERTKTVQAERERDEAREALEKVRREAWVSGMIDAANIIGRMKVEDRKQWAALDAAQDLIRAALKGDHT